MPRWLHHAFHSPEHRAYLALHRVVWSLILLAMAVFALEMTLPEEHHAQPVLLLVDHVVLALFAVEVTLRILTYRPPPLDLYQLDWSGRWRAHVLGRLRYCLRPLNLVDIVTVLALLPALRGLRALRLLRALRFFRRNDPFLALQRIFTENSLLYGFAFALLGLAVLLGGTTITLLEQRANPDVTGLADGIWWAIVTLTTVGFGDITPITPLGRLVGGATMILGMFTLALFAGIVSQTLLFGVLGLREEQTRMAGFTNHIVICGYDAGARMLLDALLAEVDPDKNPILIFADGERPREVPISISWARGDPTKESELAKARMAQARAVVMVGSRDVSPQQADAATILTAFTIRSYLRRQPDTARRRRPLYLVAEILDGENVDHARAAGADEVVESNKLAFSLLSHAVKAPGTSALISEVAVAGAQDLFVGTLPPEITDPIPFHMLVDRLKQSHDILVLGLRDTRTGQDILNPPSERVVHLSNPVIYLGTARALPPVEQG